MQQAKFSQKNTLNKISSFLYFDIKAILLLIKSSVEISLIFESFSSISITIFFLLVLLITFKILQILSKLKNREADIIRMYYGIDSQELSLEEIGTRFGMTGERIRQLKEEILNKLFTNYSNELRELL